MKEIYAVVNVYTKTIKSKWYVREGNEVRDVTLDVWLAVFDYNEESVRMNRSIIPYEYRNDYLYYSFGCGLTHYLNDRNVNEVLGEMNVECIRVYTPREFQELVLNRLKENV